MKKYKLDAIKVDDGVMYVCLTPSSRRNMIKFTPGQYAAIGFRSNSGKLTPMRCFSIVSSANHPEKLMFTIRLGGHFTTALSHLNLGTEFFIEGPYGEFLVNKFYDKHVVMLAGGIGITPFISMVRTLHENHENIPITLLYSYRSGHHIPYQKQLAMLADNYPSFRLRVFDTSSVSLPNSPRLFSGNMTEDHISEVVGGNYNGATYFVCGPKGFMDHTVDILKANGVSDDQIKTESFIQSSKVLTKNGRSVQKLTYAFAGLIMFLGIAFTSYLGISQKAKADPLQRVVTKSGTQNGSTTTISGSSTQTSGSSTNSSSSSDQPNQSSGSDTSQSYQQPVSSVS